MEEMALVGLYSLSEGQCETLKALSFVNGIEHRRVCLTRRRGNLSYKYFASYNAKLMA